MLIRRFSISICPFSSSRSNVKKASLIHAIFSCKFSKIKPFNNFTAWVNKFKRLSNFVFSSSIFSGAICHIIFLRSKKKMAWVNAGWVIAFMTNKQFGIKFTICNFIRKAMRQFSFPTLLTTSPNNAVATNIFVTNPKPATVRLLYLIKKSLIERFAFHNREYSRQFNAVQENYKVILWQF